LYSKLNSLQNVVLDFSYLKKNNGMAPCCKLIYRMTLVVSDTRWHVSAEGGLNCSLNRSKQVRQIYALAVTATLNFDVIFP